MQETEVPSNFPIKALNCNNYNLELESCDIKRRTGIYLRTDIAYRRRSDLEEDNVWDLLTILEHTVGDIE